MNMPAGKFVVTGLCGYSAFFLVMLVLCSLALAQSQSSPSSGAPQQAQQTPTASSAQPPAAQTSDSQSSPELRTREAVSFQARVNLVPIRVVVRDSQGHAVTGLRKEDFQVFEGRTPQAISVFAVDTVTVAPKTQPNIVEATAASTASGADAPPANFVPPSRFVGILFDDIHMDIGDLQRSRIAAEKYVESSIQPTDRVAVLTMSGQTQADFTDDRDKLRETLRRLQPRSVTASDSTGAGECPSIDYYQADQMINFNDQQAANVATQDALVCAFNGDQRQIAGATSLAQSTAFRVLSSGDTQTQYALRRLVEAIRRIAVLPGQRTIVLVSPGFLYRRQEWELPPPLLTALPSPNSI